MSYDQDLARRIRAILSDVPGVVEKKMFGGVGYLVNGNMACGVNGKQLIVRLPAAEYADALNQQHVHVFDMTGRAMRGWVTIDPNGVSQDSDLQAWVMRGIHFAQTLPPK